MWARWQGGSLQESEAARLEKQAAARSRPGEAALLHGEMTVRLVIGVGGSAAGVVVVARGRRRRRGLVAGDGGVDLWLQA